MLRSSSERGESERGKKEVRNSSVNTKVREGGGTPGAEQIPTLQPVEGTTLEQISTLQPIVEDPMPQQMDMP